MKAHICLKILLSGLFLTFYFGCGSSTETRYNDKEGKKAPKTNTELDETFDFTPYKTKIEIQGSKKYINGKEINAWYDYPATIDTSTTETIVNTVYGYRIRVTSTDNLLQADSLRSILASELNQKKIYILFDPPFYRIDVGDFTEISPARDLKFKLNQIGYSEARIINEKVNVYQ
ncbi:MAG TPA: hypothetical protein VKA26_02070 [Ignavibacteriaceae bacterium]|nr:hypothetical protein [Ignavibacteriaceae bacterium]